MAIAKISYFSQVMNFSADMNVILPQSRMKNEKFPVLYLLHGLTDNHDKWLEMTALSKYAAELYPELCVVMPAGDKSFYCDMVHGKPYYSHIAKELPLILASMFHITSDREKTYIAGLSMGGYGALKIGLANPKSFSKIASFSPVADMESSLAERKNNDIIKWNELIVPIYGTNAELKDIDNTKVLAQECIDKGVTPSIMLCCGKDDSLYPNYCGYADYLDSIGYKHIRHDDANHSHTWDYWDICIQRALKFFKS